MSEQSRALRVQEVARHHARSILDQLAEMRRRDEPDEFQSAYLEGLLSSLLLGARSRPITDGYGRSTGEMA